MLVSLLAQLFACASSITPILSHQTPQHGWHGHLSGGTSRLSHPILAKHFLLEHIRFQLRLDHHLQLPASEARQGPRWNWGEAQQNPMIELCVNAQPSSKVFAFFVVASIATWLVVVAYFCLNSAPSEPAANPFSHLWTRYVRTPVQSRVKDSWMYADSLYRSILTLNDLQMVTGLAIALAGTFSFVGGSITVYHFTAVTDMAWCSANSHYLTLSVINHQTFRENARRQYDVRHRKLPVLLSTWRIVCMLVLFVLLMISSWISGNRHWDQLWSCPVVCLSRNPRSMGGSAGHWAIANLVMVGYGIVATLLQLYRLLWTRPLHVRARLLHLSRNATAKQAAWVGSSLELLMPAGRLLTTAKCFLYSEIGDVGSIAGWIIATVTSARQHRKQGQKQMHGPEDRAVEWEWGFGQWVRLDSPIYFRSAYH